MFLQLYLLDWWLWLDHWVHVQKSGLEQFELFFCFEGTWHFWKNLTASGLVWRVLMRILCCFLLYYRHDFLRNYLDKNDRTPVSSWLNFLPYTKSVEICSITETSNDRPVGPAITEMGTRCYQLQFCKESCLTRKKWHNFKNLNGDSFIIFVFQISCYFYLKIVNLREKVVNFTLSKA